MFKPSLVEVILLLASGNSKSWINSILLNCSSTANADLRFLRLFDEPDLLSKSGSDVELAEPEWLVVEVEDEEDPPETT